MSGRWGERFFYMITPRAKPRQLLSDRQRRDWLRLIKSENVGPMVFRSLLNRFGSASAALAALPELSARGGLKRPIRLCSIGEAEHDLEAAERIGAKFCALGEYDYPPLLKQIEDAPPLICVKGNAELFRLPTIAVVGARNASVIGRKFTRQLCTELGRQGFVVVSGLARGIDTACHEAALDTGTVAVTAGGVDVIYPPENAELHEKIAERGAVISEMVPGLRPQAKHFPRRNRLISGMCYGSIVVEAAKRSGSLITARFALEQGREVFAVPGSPLDPRSAGANALIRNGATLVTQAADIIEVLAPMIANPAPPRDFSHFKDSESDEMTSQEPLDGTIPTLTARERVASLLSHAPTEIDDIIRESNIDVGVIHMVLLELELAGRLARLDARRVTLL